MKHSLLLKMKIIIFRDYYTGKTLLKIGRRLGVTKQRVSQILREQIVSLWGSYKLSVSVFCKVCSVCGERDYYKEKFYKRLNNIVWIHTESYVCPNCQDIYRCSCGTVGSIFNFSVVREVTHKGTCKKCAALYATDYYKKHPEDYRRNNRNWAHEHRDYFNKYYKRKRKERAELGLCTLCGEKVKNKEKLCSKCRERHRLSNQKHLEKCKTLGLCRCGAKKDDGFNSCPACRKKRMRAYRRRFG